MAVATSTARGSAVRLVIVAIVGLAVGVATSYLQGVLPDSANFLANSGAVWSVIAFALAAWVATRVGVAIAGGVLALLGEVLGYYAIASPLRHIATSTAERTLWVLAALVIGIVVGVLARFARHGRPAQRVAAVAAAGGIVLGEGVYALVELSHAVQGVVELAVGAVIVAVGTFGLARRWPDRAASLPAAAVVAVVVYGAYSLV